MLSELELKKYYAEHGLSRNAIEYIEETITAPSRLVGTNADGNVCTDFVSSKSGFSVQTEGRTTENSFAIEFEFKDLVLVFFDQSALVMVFKTNKNGVKRLGPYIPDFLVLEITGPYVLEVKTLEELQILHAENPDDWLFINGEYIYKPAREKFEELGLRHVVRSTAELSAIRTENLRLLIYARESEFVLTDDNKRKIINAFKDDAWMRLSNLCEKLGSKDTTPIFHMILNEELFINIDDELLSSPESLWISPVKEMLDICKQNQELEFLNNPLLSTEIEVELNSAPDLKQAQRALRRLERVENNENSSSIRRYKKQISDGAEKGLSPFESLLDNSHKQGNYKSKLPPVVKRTLINFIKGKYSTPTRLIKKSAYAVYKYIAKKKHHPLDPVCRNTFFAYKRLENQTEIARGRGGRRAANAAKNPTDVTKREIRGTVPFTFATLDHYLADIFLVLAVVNGYIYSFRPWISVLVDYTTRSTLAYWISFRSPSCSACAMVLRQCVRIFGKLPNEILVDGGKEFDSVYFRSLLAHYRVNRVLRPAEDPRFGSEGERTFGEMKT
jgi:putative transposase